MTKFVKELGADIGRCTIHDCQHTIAELMIQFVQLPVEVELLGCSTATFKKFSYRTSWVVWGGAGILHE